MDAPSSPPRRCPVCGCLPVEWLSIREVARILRVTKKTILSYIRNGKLYARRFGRLWRVRHSGRDPNGIPGLDDFLTEE